MPKKIVRGKNRQCVFAITGGRMDRYYKMKRGLNGLSVVPTIFGQKQKTDRTLKYQTHVSPDDTKMIPREKQKTRKGLFIILKKLHEASDRVSEKSTFLLHQTTFLDKKLTKKK